jgi:predicted amidophosphoribosyltransferase
MNPFPPFLCPACRFPTLLTLCQPCRTSIRPNTEPFDLGREGIENCFPLHLSFGPTRVLIRAWKERPGRLTRKFLHRMAPELKLKLLELHPLAVIPIPQSQRRSLGRGHDSALETAGFYAESLDRPLLPLLSLSRPDPERLTGKNRFDREFSENPFDISENFTRFHPLFGILEDRVLRGEEIRLLLVDDLITSGATLSRAAARIHAFLPRARIWVGSLGYRPKFKPESPG